MGQILNKTKAYQNEMFKLKCTICEQIFNSKEKWMRNFLFVCLCLCICASFGFWDFTSYGIHAQYNDTGILQYWNHWHSCWALQTPLLWVTIINVFQASTNRLRLPSFVQFMQVPSPPFSFCHHFSLIVKLFILFCSIAYCSNHSWFQL